MVGETNAGGGVAGGDRGFSMGCAGIGGFPCVVGAGKGVAGGDGGGLMPVDRDAGAECAI